MRLPKNLSDCCTFAHWCAREGKDPASVARLLVLARRAKRALELECNIDLDSVRARSRHCIEDFERAAQELDYGTEWNGLWPTLRKFDPIRGVYSDVYLPEVN